MSMISFTKNPKPDYFQHWSIWLWQKFNYNFRKQIKLLVWYSTQKKNIVQKYQTQQWWQISNENALISCVPQIINDTVNINNIIVGFKNISKFINIKKWHSIKLWLLIFEVISHVTLLSTLANVSYSPLSGQMCR